MESSSTKLPSGPAPSNGMRGVHVEEPAAVRAELFDRDLGRDRPASDRLVEPLDPVRDGRARERLHDALGDDHDGDDHREGQQDVDDAAHGVAPEVADILRAGAGESTDQRDEHCHADRRGHEVLEREPQHLREVGHGGLAAVGLPVRVGREAGGRVERNVLVHAAEPHRVEREVPLHTHQDVEEHRADRAEPQGAGRVALPGLLDRGVDPDQPVDDSLETTGPLRRVHAVHVRADRRRERRQDDQVDQDRRHVRTTPVGSARSSGRPASATEMISSSTSATLIPGPAMRRVRRRRDRTRSRGSPSADRYPCVDAYALRMRDP